jgi:hypothetical protein
MGRGKGERKKGGLWLGGRRDGTDIMLINNSVRYLRDVCDCIQFMNCLDLPLIAHTFLISSYLNI